ncbi:MAG: hypothetical protein QOK40_2005, partial [Miltoncostaeaceae bacterium]|nr:hypothetical protein [Miltoncostaeaceae bacterium]
MSSVARDRLGQLLQALKLGHPPALPLVAVGGSPPRRRLGGQGLGHLLVFGAEVAAHSLGQVEVAEDLPRSATGTPRKLSIGGWAAGKPTERGSSAIRRRRRGRASRIS